MDVEVAVSLCCLFADRSVAVFVTLHGGESAVSMVSFVLLVGSTMIVIYVSVLVIYMCDMECYSCVVLLVMDEFGAGGLLS